MPAYSKEREQYYIERIKGVLDLKLNASTMTIHEALAKDTNAPLSLARVYIEKLRRKIDGERAHRFDDAKVGKRLAEIQDRTESVIAQMWRVLLDPNAPEVARVSGGRAIIEAEHRLFDAQLNAGIFERKLGSVEIQHIHELAPEHKLLILHALANYGIINYQLAAAGLPEPRAGAIAHRQ